MTNDFFDCQPCVGCIKWAHKRCANENFHDGICRICQEFTENTIYALGILNPGENLCWLNASLHVLLSLPIFKNLEYLCDAGIIGHTQLLDAFLNIQMNMREGHSAQRVYEDIL